MTLKPTIRHSRDQLDHLFDQMEPSILAFRAGQIQGYELVSQLLIQERENLYPGSIWMGAMAENHIEVQNAPLTTKLLHKQLRGCPLIVQSGLCRWALENWNVPVVDYKPSPIELLREQADGRRPLTFFFEKTRFVDFFEEIHTSFGLIIHDVIHAFRYFDDFKNQRELSQFYMKIYHPMIERLGSVDFNRQLDYIVADMNTHPKHSLLTLRALLLSTLKVENELELKDWLDDFGNKNGIVADAIYSPAIYSTEILN